MGVKGRRGGGERSQRGGRRRGERSQREFREGRKARNGLPISRSAGQWPAWARNLSKQASLKGHSLNKRQGLLAR